MLIALNDLPRRRRAAAPGGPLASLFDSLAAELEPWLERPVYVPESKALLSRIGGRCEADGATLEFDPASPHQHRCPVCARTHTGELHHRAWVMPYQLWLAERALHGALFHLLRGDVRHATFARTVLTELASRYATYPNVDNVLGPSRLFFSTYLESVWLLQLCLAAHFLKIAGDDGPAMTVRELVAEPARVMISDFSEGMSNRQVWNNAALIAAAIICDDRAAVDDRAHGVSGVASHLSHGLLADASWYEGENYHQFALRGLWYSVTLLEGQGIGLDQSLVRRFERAFAIPVVTALPDFTMPSRKDSQYAVSLRQWRMAELLELGLARQPDPLLVGALARCYEAGPARTDTDRGRSTADIERNAVSGPLARADLGWRALLHALPELPPLQRREPRSVLLEHQGYAVFRRENATYVGFECGQSGGGHGHPDRLNVTLYRGEERWLDDLGTGSYVDPSLHWFRSTLAHNAPLVDGQSQPLREAQVLAHDEREGLGWIVAALDIPDRGVRLERALLVTPDYLIDELRWTAATPVRIDLPWHMEPEVSHEAESITLEGGDGEEDGFAFVRDARRVGVGQSHTVRSTVKPVSLFLQGDQEIELFVAAAPGQPPSTFRRFLVARSEGASGRFRSVLAWHSSATIRLNADAIVVSIGGEEHRHSRDDRGWHVEFSAGGARSSIDLSGIVAPLQPRVDAAHHRAGGQPLRVHRSAGSFSWLSEQRRPGKHGVLLWELGEFHYRRSELDWQAAGRPTAHVAVSASPTGVVVHVVARAGDPVFVAADASNPFDNEQPDTMGAGIQLHMNLGGVLAGWMLVPEDSSSTVRVRTLAAGAVPAPQAVWRLLSDGYEMRIELPRAISSDAAFSLDVLVNETTRGRTRRRGQLVLSGARGEFVYLRGDRHDDDRFVPLVVVP